MNRCVAFIFALLLTTLTIASACTAASSDPMRFTIEPSRSGDQVRVEFRHDGRSGGDNQWSSDFPVAELAGLDLAALRAGGAHPLRFALVREAGRLDCAGSGGESFAHGSCGFTPDPAFIGLLESRGIARPDRGQALGLMALNVRRELIDTIARARYPVPTLDDLMSMTAVGVSAQYIDQLARLGYRPASIDSLVEFRALNISPEYIAQMSAAGFRNLPPDDLVQLKAMNVSPDYLSDLARIGYGTMSPDDVVQMKAMNITPAYIAGFQQLGYQHLSPDVLVELKALDITPDYVRSVGAMPGGNVPVDELVRNKLLGHRH